MRRARAVRRKGAGVRGQREQGGEARMAERRGMGKGRRGGEGGGGWRAQAAEEDGVDGRAVMEREKERRATELVAKEG